MPLPVLAHCTQMFAEDVPEVILNAVPLDGAEAELQHLRSEGLEFTAYGTMAVGVEPRINLRESFEPARGVMGILVRALARKERQSFVVHGEALSATEELRRDTARIHSC